MVNLNIASIAAPDNPSGKALLAFIVIAIISAVAAVAVSVANNWDKIVDKPTTSTTTSSPMQVPGVQLQPTVVTTDPVPKPTPLIIPIAPITSVGGAPITSVGGALPTAPAPTGACFTDGSSLRFAVRQYLLGSTSIRSTYGSISDWCVSSVQDFNDMFYDESGTFQSFNEDISRWDTSSATSMYRMFKYANSFNPTSLAWNVDKVTEMSQMFWDAFSFNGDISTWNVGNVINAEYMFHGAKSFNQDVSNWDVSKLQKMTGMFIDATAFNSDLSNWNVQSATDLRAFCGGCTLFNQNLCTWTTTLPSYVTVDIYMFEGTNCPVKDFIAPKQVSGVWTGPFCYAC